MHDGRTLERIEPYNRGSSKFPMSADDVKAKFRDNASFVLKPDRIAQVESLVDRLETLADARELVTACCP